MLHFYRFWFHSYSSLPILGAIVGIARNASNSTKPERSTMVVGRQCLNMFLTSLTWNEEFWSAMVYIRARPRLNWAQDAALSVGVLGRTMEGPDTARSLIVYRQSPENTFTSKSKYSKCQHLLPEDGIWGECGSESSRLSVQ